MGHERSWGEHGRSRRKERVLHTRITDQLAEDIRRVAEDLRVPVSNLVRNVLEEAFSVVEQVSGDVGGLVDEVVEEAERARERLRELRRQHHGEAGEPVRDEPAAADLARDFPDVVAWQPVLLNSRQRCAVTGRELAPGEAAHAGLTARGLADIYLGEEAMRERGAAG